jgi:ABC-type transport system involved in multi-copper enzyme maturation permease subunit
MTSNKPDPSRARLPGRFWLFGPFLTFDLARRARSVETYVQRAFLPGALLLLLGGGLFGLAERHARQRYQEFSLATAALSLREMAKFTEETFYSILFLQFVLAVLATPALVAPTITREKECKTLEFLLAADLNSTEIVLGKVLGRLGQVASFLLSALPVYCVMQFWGDVEPALIFAGLAGTALTVAGLAGVSILASVLVRRSRTAIALSYLAPVLYAVLCVGGQGLIDGGRVTPAPLFGGGPSAVDCVHAFQAGNPFFALSRAMPAPPRRGPRPTVASATSAAAGVQSLSEVLRDYTIFYALLTGSTVTLAVLRLRPVALREAGENKGLTRRRDLPPVGDRPVLWKEMHCGGFKLPWWGKLLVLALVAWSFEPALAIWSNYAGGALPPGTTMSGEVNEYVCHVSTYVACLLMLAAAVRGATAVRVEKDKGTLDALLTSPLSTREILFGKWVGCLWGLRWPALWPGAIYLVGVATGGLSPLALPLLAAALLFYCGCMALVGLLCSVGNPPAGSPSVAVSAVTAVTLSVALWFMHWPLVAAGLGAYRLAVPETAIGDVLAKYLAGMTPPAVLMTALPFTPEDLPYRHTAGNPGMIVRALIGLLYWAALARVLWRAAIKAFEKVYNRGDVRSPDGLQKKRERGKS